MQLNYNSATLTAFSSNN